MSGSTPRCRHTAAGFSDRRKTHIQQKRAEPCLVLLFLLVTVRKYSSWNRPLVHEVVSIVCVSLRFECEQGSAGKRWCHTVNICAPLRIKDVTDTCPFYTKYFTFFLLFVLHVAFKAHAYSMETENRCIVGISDTMCRLQLALTPALRPLPPTKPTRWFNTALLPF